MRKVNVLEAKTNLSRLIDAVESGAEDEIIIARNGQPAARLVPVAQRKPVALGMARHLYDPEKHDLDAMFSPEIEAQVQALFEENTDAPWDPREEAVLLDPKDIKLKP